MYEIINLINNIKENEEYETFLDLIYLFQKQTFYYYKGVGIFFLYNNIKLVYNKLNIPEYVERYINGTIL